MTGMYFSFISMKLFRTFPAVYQERDMYGKSFDKEN